jgi:AraC-like DNA-binding protein
MAAFSGTVAASNARRVLAYGASRGLGKTSLAEPEAHASRISTAHMFDIWAHLARRLDAPDLPITMARDFQLEDLELFGFVMLTAPTLRESVESFVRYCALLNDGPKWEVIKEARRITVRLLDPCPRVLGARISHETAFAQMVRAVRQLSGGSIDPLSVSFAHAAPSELRAHRALFRCELSFGAASDEIVFARDAFEDAPAAGNPALWRYLRVQADAALGQLAPRPLADRVRDEVTRMVASGAAPEMGAIAETLGTTERTLRRALAKTGTSFRQLVDDTRRARVEELLATTPESLARVAFDAGFSDASSLTHACRRWFGRVPSDLVRRSG